MKEDLNFRTRRRRQLAAAAAASVIAAVSPIVASTASASNASVTSNQLPITVGVISDLNGAAPSTEVPRDQAFVATVNWANANGGINGHPIKLVTQLDTGQQPANLTAAQSLVQNQGATIIVEISNAMAGAAPWLSANGIPTICYSAFSSAVSQYRTLFAPNGGYNTNPTLWNTDAATFFKRIGAKKVGGFSQGASATSVEITANVVNSAPLVGLKKGYLDTTVPSGNTNWTPYVLGFQNTQTDAVEVHPSDAAVGTLGFIAAEEQQGLHLKVMSPALYNQSLLTGPTNALMQGAYVYTQYDPNQNGAAIKKMVAILGQYGDAANATVAGSNEVSGYTVALLLFEALRVGGVNPTSKAIVRNLSHVTNWASGGIYGHPINFALEHTSKAPTVLGHCLWFLEAEGTSFVQLFKGKPICTPTVQIHF